MSLFDEDEPQRPKARPEVLAFLADSKEHPEDDTPRLAYADWLAENGHDARAEFIRTQIEISRVETLPRVTCRPTASRTRGSSGSFPGGSRSRRSNPRPLTLRTSQCQVTPSCAPSARAKPVMLLMLIAAPLGSGAGSPNASRNLAVRATANKPPGCPR